MNRVRGRETMNTAVEELLNVVRVPAGVARALAQRRRQGAVGSPAAHCSGCHAQKPGHIDAGQSAREEGRIVSWWYSVKPSQARGRETINRGHGQECYRQELREVQSKFVVRVCPESVLTPFPL